MNVGVEVTTGLRTGPSNPGPPSGIFQIAGVTERGPVDAPVLVKSIGQYSASFGGRTPYSSNMLDSARMFFEEGGSELLVSRAVGPSATAGFLELQDSSEAPTVRVEARNPGNYSQDYLVSVTGSGSSVTLTVADGDEVIASFRNVTSVAEIVAAGSNNRFLKISDLGAGTLPVAVEPTAMTAGSDNRDQVTTEQIIEALEAAGDKAAGGAVAAPGYPADTIGAALIDYASRVGAIALLAPHTGASKAEAIQTADGLANSGSGAYGGVFWPHLIVPDGTGTRVISPEGYIAAVRTRAFNETGFWATPAGERATTQWVNGTVTEVSPSLNNELSAGLVNGIVTVGGRTRLYNWRSLSTDYLNFGLLSARDTLNNLVMQIKAVLEPFVFQTVDGRGHLFSQVEGAAVGVLDPIATAGGFYARLDGEDEIDPGYRVTVDSTNNELSSLEENIVLVDISVRLSPVAALIKAEIVKVPLAAAM